MNTVSRNGNFYINLLLPEDRKQSVFVNNFCLSFLKLISGAPQESMLGALLCNIFPNDMVHQNR